MNFFKSFIWFYWNFVVKKFLERFGYFVEAVWLQTFSAIRSSLNLEKIAKFFKFWILNFLKVYCHALFCFPVHKIGQFFSKNENLRIFLIFFIIYNQYSLLNYKLNIFYLFSITNTCQPQCRNAALNLYQNRLGRALLRTDVSCIPGRYELEYCHLLPNKTPLYCNLAKLACEADLMVSFFFFGYK